MGVFYPLKQGSYMIRPAPGAKDASSSHSRLTCDRRHSRDAFARNDINNSVTYTSASFGHIHYSAFGQIQSTSFGQIQSTSFGHIHSASFDHTLYCLVQGLMRRWNFNLLMPRQANLPLTTNQDVLSCHSTGYHSHARRLARRVVRCSSANARP